jgi:isoleucyl-tRNA synthetase
VAAKLQLFCSEDLGAFYLDVLKDRLYTTAPNSLARRSAQTALWQIAHAMLRWMAPFLSFTAEEAWKVFDGGDSIFTQTYWRFDPAVEADAERLARWARIRSVRDAVNKEIEALRGTGAVGSSLQAEVRVTAGADDHSALACLGDDLKFVFITSAAELVAGDGLQIAVQARDAAKCERCWHWRQDVGHDPAHPTICGRCSSNLFGAGEVRRAA